jgi:hypothetical protein
MVNLQTKHDETSTTQVETKNGISKYSFKKRKPLPGAYPKNFSPYLLTNTSTTRVVPLSRLEIRKDLHDIHEAMANEFSSNYFEEVGTAPKNGQNVEEPNQKPKNPFKIQRRAPRRPNFCSIQAPMTEAEERRQLRAALKASQLEAKGMMDEHGCSKMRISDEEIGIASKQEASDDSVSLRRVCRGHMFRTG